MEVDPTPEAEDVEQMEGADSFLQDLAGSIPGIDEAMSFAEVLKQVQTLDYQTIVFDTAPTGHTLRLLQFPTVLEKGLSKIMSLKSSFGGMMSTISSMMGGANMEADDMLSKLEGLKTVVEEVNKQFKDPDLTTFVCVCIPEFLSLYETERLVQELANYEIDTRNIVINQVLYPEGATGQGRLLAARMRMQQKYLEQFYDLYEDFHIVKMPLLCEEVRGVDALRSFSGNLMEPYVPPEEEGEETLGAEVDRLRARVKELEEQLKDKQ